MLQYQPVTGFEVPCEIPRSSEIEVEITNVFEIVSGLAHHELRWDVCVVFRTTQILPIYYRPTAIQPSRALPAVTGRRCKSATAQDKTPPLPSPSRQGGGIQIGFSQRIYFEIPSIASAAKQSVVPNEITGLNRDCHVASLLAMTRLVSALETQELWKALQLSLRAQRSNLYSRRKGTRKSEIASSFQSYLSRARERHEGCLAFLASS